MSAILLDDDGNPAKFFIQKDLPPSVLSALTTEIPANGGLVIDRVPNQGFVLVDPASQEGQRLLQRWRTSDKPHRRIVPVTFIAACIQAKGIIPPIFTSGDGPLLFHIHESVRKPLQRDRAAERIWHSGGDPTSTPGDADVIIVEDDDPTNLARVRQAYTLSTRLLPVPVHVESLSWIKRCINAAVLKYSRVPLEVAKQQKETKRRKSGGRQEFSADDDVQLIAYLARHAPDKATSGRLGNKLYKDLCGDEQQYPWASRHPWRSWRERYKKNTDRLDPAIQKYVREHNIELPASDDDNDGDPPPAREPRTRRTRAGAKSKTTSNVSVDNEDEVDELQSSHSSGSRASPEAPPVASTSTAGAAKKRKPGPKSRDKLKADARVRPRDSWGSDAEGWAIRVAEDEDTRPAWAKRKRSQEDDDDAPDEAGPTKRTRTFSEKPNSYATVADEPVASSANSDGPEILDLVPFEILPAPALLHAPALLNATATLNGANKRPLVAQPSEIPPSVDSQSRSRSVSDDGDEDTSGMGQATQELLVQHRNALQPKPLRAPAPALALVQFTTAASKAVALAPPPPTGKLSVGDRLQLIAERHRFYTEDVTKFYERSGDFARTDAVFERMRTAADVVMEAEMQAIVGQGA